MREKQYISFSVEDTEVVGANLSLSLMRAGFNHAFIALYGEMGVGKTAFVRGFSSALGVKSVHSPTYTVVNEYQSGKIPVFHFDMYRAESADDLLSVGFEDYLRREGYILCEWSENIEDQIPTDAIRVTLTRTDGEDGRKIVIQTPQ